MTDTNTDDRVRARRAVRQIIDDADAVTWAECIKTTATVTGMPADIVADELEALEREGFVYRTGQHEDAEVRLP